RPATTVLAFGLLAAATAWGFGRLPTGFLPVEDQGYVVAGIQLPDSASQARTRRVVDQVNRIIGETPGVANWNTVGGNSILDGATASNAATFYVVFKPWEERKAPSLRQDAILTDLRRRLAGVQEAISFAFPPPAIDGLGVAGGFQLQLQDR